MAQKADLARIAELEAVCFREPWTEESLRVFCNGSSFVAVLFDGDELISYCTLFSVLDEGQIINVATKKEHRARGHAENVLNFVFEECKKRELCSLSLEVRRSNIGAISLYKKLGFEVAGERKGFYRDPREDALVMIKNI